MSQRRLSKNSRNLSQAKDVAELKFEEVVNNVVRYIIYRAGDHTSFTKTELMRNVTNKSTQFDQIMQEAGRILNTVYGYNVIKSNTVKGKEKSYIVSNALPYIDVDEESNRVPEDVNNILILLILSHILMSHDSASDISLYNFLKSLHIDSDSIHPIFGKVKEFINKTLVKQQYLRCETNNDTKSHTYMWGIRAEQEVSKKAVLEFVCKMYKGMQAKDWASQFKSASKQHLENDTGETSIED